MTRPIRVAYGSVPKDGGTFTFYRNLRPALRPLGVEMRCVSVGWAQNALAEPAFVDDGCVALATGTHTLKRQARAFVDWCQAEAIDVVMAINSEGILSALPHLPERIRVVARCANGFDQGYRVTMSGRERLARIVALVPRLRDDLVAGYGADAGAIALIPNGIAPEAFEAAAARRRGTSAALEIGFLGRLEHRQKGVLHLPGIADALVRLGVPFRLRIAGKGKHEPELRAALAGHLRDGRVQMLGALGPAAVPEFLGSIDALAFTSHFEGCPNALLEAMMAGVVPVSWRIEGITDFLIDEGRTGFLHETGNVDGFAARLAALSHDRAALDAVSRAVAVEARARFTDAASALAWAELFRTVMDEPPPPWTPKPWSTFRADPNLRRDWRRWLPTKLKGWAGSMSRGSPSMIEGH